MVTISTNTMGPSLPRRRSPSMVHLRPSFRCCKAKRRPDLLFWKAGDRREIILRCVAKQNLHRCWIQDALQFHCYWRKCLFTSTDFEKFGILREKDERGNRFCMAARKMLQWGNDKARCRYVSPRYVSWVDYLSDHVISYYSPRSSMYSFLQCFVIQRSSTASIALICSVLFSELGRNYENPH